MSAGLAQYATCEVFIRTKAIHFNAFIRESNLKGFKFVRHFPGISVPSKNTIQGKDVGIPIRSHEGPQRMWMQGFTFTQPRH